MFYPVDSLKRGGRFYLCWVADSWPLRFATITHRQLWSQDVRKICDDLMEVIVNESGRPKNRFSLRLSSQLMRGVARLYQRKVSIFLSELCMINATVIKHANKKYHDEPPHPHERRRHVANIIEPQLVVQVVMEEPENEQRVEQLIQNSGNVVSNIQDITLKEATIPDFRLPANDGFGEENPNQALNILVDRTMEMMMVPTDGSIQHSGLELPGLDSTEKSHDKTRLMPHELQMERISEHEMSMFRPSIGEALLQVPDLEKEIPEIPDIPIPEIPPQDKIQEEIPPVVEKVPSPAQVVPEARVEPMEVQVAQPEQRLEEMELEELEATEPQTRRRRPRKLIIDKKIKISSEALRARIDNINVELRCMDSSDDIIEIRVPTEAYFHRPSSAGSGLHSNIAAELSRMFLRNLGVIHRAHSADRELETAMHRPQRRPRSLLERIQEVEEPQPEIQQPISGQEIMAQEITTREITAQDITAREITAQDITAREITMPEIPQEIVPDVNLSNEVLRVEQERTEDISDLLTQKIETLSQAARKRTSVREEEPSVPAKKSRSIGYISFRKSQEVQQQMQQQQMQMEVDVQQTLVQEPPPNFELPEADKENVPQNFQNRRSQDAEKRLSGLLQQAGLADIPTATEETQKSQRKSKNGSSGSETPLGSLDRTKVSLGDSTQTTDSKRFIRDQWGPEGTMVKIIQSVKEDNEAVTVENLVSKGPIIPGYKRMIAARCFNSILKLKQHSFIIVKKNPETLEVEDIRLGTRFD